MTKSLQTPGGICAKKGLIEGGGRAVCLAFGGISFGSKVYACLTLEPQMSAAICTLEVFGLTAV